MYVEQATEILRPPEFVFDFLAHHPNHVQFIEQNISCEQVSPGPMAVGTRVKNTANLFGPLGGRIDEYFEIVTFEPARVLKKESREGSSFDTSDTFQLEPTANGTKVTLIVTGASKSLPKRALLVVMQPIVNAAIKKALAKLKTILEAKA